MLSQTQNHENIKEVVRLQNLLKNKIPHENVTTALIYMQDSDIISALCKTKIPYFKLIALSVDEWKQILLPVASESAETVAKFIYMAIRSAPNAGYNIPDPTAHHQTDQNHTNSSLPAVNSSITYPDATLLNSTSVARPSANTSNIATTTTNSSSDFVNIPTNLSAAAFLNSSSGSINSPSILSSLPAVQAAKSQLERPLTPNTCYDPMSLSSLFNTASLSSTTLLPEFSSDPRRHSAPLTFGSQVTPDGTQINPMSFAQTNLNQAVMLSPQFEQKQTAVNITNLSTQQLSNTANTLYIPICYFSYHDNKEADPKALATLVVSCSDDKYTLKTFLEQNLPENLLILVKRVFMRSYPYGELNMKSKVKLTKNEEVFIDCTGKEQHPQWENICEIKISQSQVTRVIKRFKLSDGNQAKVYECDYYPATSSESIVVKFSKNNQEHRILKRLRDCEGVVPVKFFGTVNLSNKHRFALGVPLLITLEDYFDSNDLECNDIKFIAQSLLDNLKEIHQYDVIHRDIKPSNILVTSDLSQVYISDFDCACINHKQKLSSESGFVGTRMFASCNALRGHSPSIDDDYESLCYTIYWLCHPNQHLNWKQARPTLDDMIKDDDVVKHVYDCWQQAKTN